MLHTLWKVLSSVSSEIADFTTHA